MRGGVLLIAAALLLAYLGVTGRYKCVTKAFGCLLGTGGDCDCNKAAAPSATTPSTTPPFAIPGISPLQGVEPLRGIYS